MKKTIFLFFTLSSFVALAQEVKEKEIQVIEETEVKVRNVSFGILAGGVMYYGEEPTDLTFDYGVSLRKHINPKFDIDFNVHYGETKYVVDSLDLSESISYYGVNSTFNVNLIEAFTNKETYSLISPYVGSGIGLMSSRPYKSNREFVFFYLPASAGININPSDRFIIGLHATGRFLLSDNWDNSKVTSAKDFLFYPSASLRYVFGLRNKTKRSKVNKTITYKENYTKSNGQYEKYNENEIEPLIEISVREFRDSSDVNSGVSTNNSGASNNSGSSNESSTTNTSNSSANYLFYTVQIATFKTNNVNIEEGAGVKEDFQFYNTKTNRYNYCKGFYASVEDAQADLKEIKKKNPLAFVTAINNGEKIKLYFAKQRLNNGETKVDIDAAKSEYLK